MMKPPRAPADLKRTRNFKETARHIAHMDRAVLAEAGDVR
jgi:hypothetical protein